MEKSETFIAGLESIEYHSGEANTDKEQKNIVKNYLLTNNCLRADSIENFVLVNDDNENKISISDLNEIIISNVYLPDELTDKHKLEIKNLKANGAVYANPDLLVEVVVNRKVRFVSLELKSTKQDKIPGSSAQQVNPYEWTIFIKQQSGKNACTVATGLYACAITGRIPFPDRSPRPQVSFSKLSTWNSKNRKLYDNEYVLTIDNEELSSNATVVSDWRYSLIEDWMSYVKTDKNSSRWFDEALRVFSYELIVYYESLDDHGKRDFLDHQVGK